jgi:hypothetical protein
MDYSVRSIDSSLAIGAAITTHGKERGIKPAVIQRYADPLEGEVLMREAMQCHANILSVLNDYLYRTQLDITQPLYGFCATLGGSPTQRELADPWVVRYTYAAYEFSVT